MGKEGDHFSSSPTDPEGWGKEKEGTSRAQWKTRDWEASLLGVLREAFGSRVVVEGGGVRRKKWSGSQAQRTRTVGQCGVGWGEESDTG